MKFQHTEPASLVEEMAKDDILCQKTKAWMDHVLHYKYTYGFSWLGRPIIQQPQDMIAVQEIIWHIKPDLIIETGIAHGGSLIYYASLLELIGGDGRVIGVDIAIRKHNRIEIEKHSMANRIKMIEGSSIEENVVKEVSGFTAGKKCMVILDSNHTHEHVFSELKLYSPFVNKGSYLIVFDTRIEDAPQEFFKSKLWGKGNNPKTAVWDFLKINNRFEPDRNIENKFLITSAPSGYLKCIKN